jgi:hypothetical protein
MGFIWDKIAPIVDDAGKYLEKQNPDAATGGSWSFDWCRFRGRRRCYFPEKMNEEATKLAGYTVWIPEDRGLCGRDKWEDQKTCPVSEPGPNSGDPKGGLDCTVAWEDGGQHGGVYQ